MSKIKAGTIGTVVANISEHYFEVGQQVKFIGYDENNNEMWEALDGSAFWWAFKGKDIE